VSKLGKSLSQAISPSISIPQKSLHFQIIRRFLGPIPQCFQQIRRNLRGLSYKARELYDGFIPLPELTVCAGQFQTEGIIVRLGIELLIEGRQAFC